MFSTDSQSLQCIHLCDAWHCIILLYNYINRHATDNVRQRDLAKRRTQLRSQRLQQNQEYEKQMITAPDPTHGTLRILNQI